MRSRINQTANRIETKRMRIEGGPRGRRTGHSRAAARNHGERSETAGKSSERNSSRGRWKRTAGGTNVSRMSNGKGRCSNRSEVVREGSRSRTDRRDQQKYYAIGM